MTPVFAVCPICGGPLFDREIAWFPEARTLVSGQHGLIFSRNESRMFNALWEARHRGSGVPREKIMDAMYFDDPNGGAESESIINVLAHRMRKLLKPMNLTVEGIKGASSMYWLKGR